MITASAATIAKTLGGACRSGDWWRCRCPVHNSKGSTLALRDAASGLAVHCHAGCPRDDILDELRRLDLLGERSRPVVADPAGIELRREAERRNREQRTAAALDYWRHETVPAEGTVVEAYWRSRGLGELSLPTTVHAARSWLRHPEGGSRPVMVALVEHVEQGPVGIHRTFLAIDGSGKASFRVPRLSLGPISGGAVRLAPANERQQLVIAEGIETAASVMLSTGFPAWAALSAGGIEGAVLPPLPIASEVTIAADHDRSGVGVRAARTAAERWLAEGRRVRVALPPMPGSDWNDVLLNTDIDVGEARDASVA